MATYQIIDEPKSRPALEKFIVDPTVILLVSILVPFFWNPPALGRFWIPAVWLVFNGYALGSPTLGKEIRTLLFGALGLFVLLRGSTVLINADVIPYEPADLAPYLVTLLFGGFFLTLYLVVFRQSTSHALYQYVRGDDS